MPGKVATMLDEKMQELGLGIRDVAAQVDISYEFARRLVKGEALPSKWVLLVLSEKLNLDKSELEQAAVADRIQAKFGDAALKLAGKDPEIQPFINILQQLDEGRRKTAMLLLRGLLSEQQEEQPHGRRRMTVRQHVSTRKS